MKQKTKAGVGAIFAQAVRRLRHRQKMHELSIHASSSSFYLVLSLVPFLLLLVQLLWLLPIEDMQIMIPQGVFPESISGFMRMILTEVEDSVSATVLSASAIAALWAAGKGAVAIRRGLMSVQGEIDKRGYLRSRILGSLYIVILLLAMAAIVLLIVFGRILISWSEMALPQVSKILSFCVDMPVLAELVLLTTFVLLVFQLASSRQKWRKNLWGALFVAVGWIGFSWLFTEYISYFSQMSALYGSMTTIIVLMLWLYFCMNILFIGAEVNEMLEAGELDDLIGVFRSDSRRNG